MSHMLENRKRKNIQIFTISSPYTRNGELIFECEAYDVQEALEIGTRKRVKFRYANLYKVKLSGACLDGIDLTGAFIREAWISDSTFRGANLTHFSCHNSTIQNCNFEGANFNNTGLYGASHLHKNNYRGARNILFDESIFEELLKESGLSNYDDKECRIIADILLGGYTFSKRCLTDKSSMYYKKELTKLDYYNLMYKVYEKIYKATYTIDYINHEEFKEIGIRNFRGRGYWDFKVSFDLSDACKYNLYENNQVTIFYEGRGDGMTVLGNRGMVTKMYDSN